MRNILLIVTAIGYLSVFPAVADDVLDEQLLAAAKTGTPQQVEALIQQGAKIEVHNKEGWTPLHVAVTADNQPVVAVLLDKGADVNTTDKYGRTPLMSGQSAEIAKLLIERGANVNARSGLTGGTPLIIVAGLVPKQINYPLEAKAALLLAKGADVNAVDNYGRTALMAAAPLARAGMVQLLLKHGAKATMRNKNGVNALDMALFFAPGPPSASDDENTKAYYEIQKALRAHGVTPTANVTIKLPGR